MKIYFVLPRFTKKPIGGFKIVYEYANKLSRLGNDITLFFINEEVFLSYKVPKFVKSICATAMTKIEPRWFELDRNIKKISGSGKIDKKLLANADIVIATSVDTVEYTINNFPNSKKAYFIQDFENWDDVSDDYVISTYKMGLKNIVISDWLKGIVDKYADEPSILIKDPIDINVYKPSNDNRPKHSVAFLYHDGEHKGTKYTIEAIKILKDKYPDLEVYSFGTCSNNNLPSYVKYTRNASQEETVSIYNSVNVFMCSSINEGYGLTGLEAMSCGCALCSSDYQGVHEYAKDGYNALLSPIKDPICLANNVIKLFENDDLRKQLVNNGLETVKEGFTWDIATTKMINTLIELNKQNFKLKQKINPVK